MLDLPGLVTPWRNVIHESEVMVAKGRSVGGDAAAAVSWDNIRVKLRAFLFSDLLILARPKRFSSGSLVSVSLFTCRGLVSSSSSSCFQCVLSFPCRGCRRAIGPSCCPM